MLLINWYKAKKAEYKIKAMAYEFITSFTDDKSGRLQTILNLIDSVKGMTGDELKTEFISGLAGIIHEEAEQSRQNDANAE